MLTVHTRNAADHVKAHIAVKVLTDKGGYERPVGLANHRIGVSALFRHLGRTSSVWPAETLLGAALGAALGRSAALGRRRRRRRSSRPPGAPPIEATFLRWACASATLGHQKK